MKRATREATRTGRHETEYQEKVVKRHLYPFCAKGNKALIVLKKVSAYSIFLFGSVLYSPTLKLAVTHPLFNYTFQNLSFLHWHG
jgi:hypothetical protein